MKVGFIGGGKMAEAIVAALLASKTCKAHEISAGDLSADRRKALKRRFGINVYSKNFSVVEAAPTIVLAVKPQNFPDVLAELAPDLGAKHLVVSIAAGKTLAGIQTALGSDRVVRVMPNLACQVAEGVSAFCAGAGATRRDKETVEKLLASFGKVVELPEDRFDAVTAVSGSGPAFFTYVLQSIVEGGVEAGLDRDVAVLLAEQTMLGTSKLLLENGMDPEALIKAVTSPQGTTAAGLAVLEKSDVADVMRRTIRAAADRSRELSGDG